MGAITLDEIVVVPLRQIATEGGDVLHAMKSSDIGFSGYGEAYFSRVNSGAIKAWKRHSRMSMNLIVPVGTIKFVFHLETLTPNSSYRIEEIGEFNYARIMVPPGIIFGFQGMDKSSSVLLNISDIEHDPNEVERFPIDAFNFRWNEKM